MTAGVPNARLIDVELDESIGRSTPDVEHERAVAIFDLIEENSFHPIGDDTGGPYRLKLSLMESRLIFAIARETGEDVATHILSLTPLAPRGAGLFHDLRKLLPGDPLGDAKQDRGNRHGAARPAQ